jgi:hypothetical protein
MIGSMRPLSLWRLKRPISLLSLTIDLQGLRIHRPQVRILLAALDRPHYLYHFLGESSSLFYPKVRHLVMGVMAI